MLTQRIMSIWRELLENDERLTKECKNFWVDHTMETLCHIEAGLTDKICADSNSDQKSDE